MKSPRPLLLITGFLGAGKTTLLRELLKGLRKQDQKADVILNDFTNAEVDIATLDSSSATSVAPLAAGCACCESLEELVQLCRSASNGKGDLLLIELNGTADPLPLIETFTLLEDRLPFFPRLQVCVIDARHWESRIEYNLLERRQLETASFWFLSHSSGMSANRLEQIRSSIRAVAKHSSEVDLGNLLRILTEEIENCHSPSSVAKPYLQSPVGLHSEDSPAPKHQSTHVHDEPHQLSHRFTGCKIPLPPKVSTQSIRRLLDNLPNWVLRAKALVSLTEKPGTRWLFEKVGTETIPNPFPIHDLPNTPSSLMCIGPKLDPEALKRQIDSELRSKPPFSQEWA